jgi:hypothetical protein
MNVLYFMVGWWWDGRSGGLQKPGINDQLDGWATSASTPTPWA